MDTTGLVILLLSGAVGLAALLIRHWDQRFRARAQRAEAIVVDYRIETERQERDGGDIVSELHRPVFRYRDATGVEREALSRTASSPPAFALGAVVAVLYDPASPAEAVPEHDPVGRWVPTVLGLLAGVGALVAGLRAAIGGW